MNSPILFHLTPVSSNSKTGPIPVSTSGKQTCWDGCPFYDKGCYAASGPLALHWAAITKGERGLIWAEFIKALKSNLRKSAAKIWRHNQAGDLAGLGELIEHGPIFELAAASDIAGVKGFTYTHKPLLNHPAAASNIAAVKVGNELGFTINASANNLEHADKLAELGIPVCVTIPTDTPETFYTPAGRKGIVCPAQTREDINCANCRLCSRSDRSVIIGFKFHGSGAKAAAAKAAAFKA